MTDSSRPLSQLHGGEVEWAVSERYNLPIEKIISFASTVSPITPDHIFDAPEMLDQMYLYAPSDLSKLKAVVAKYQDVRENTGIIFGCGSTELIHLFAQVMCKGEAIIPIPTYGEYETAVNRYGGRPVFVEPSEDFGLDLQSIKRSISRRTKAIILCNPNNPSGRLFDKQDMEEIADLAKEKGIIVLVDEAYSCFVTPRKKYSMSKNVNSHPVIVLNSFSKLFGIPSLRLGWGLASDETVAALEKFKVPWTISNITIWAAQRLLQDGSHQEKVKDLISSQRKEMITALQQISWLKTFPSDTNFLLIKIQDPSLTSHDIFDRLVAKGLVIRDCSMMRGLGESYFRITLRTPEHNSLLVSELGKIGVPIIASWNRQ